MFLVSGATGLLYEVAFSKVLATIFGATAYAISTVLSAFMAGLALGAYLGGRIAHRLRAPLAGYGYAEILVGLVIAATPWAFDALASAYLVLARGTQDIFTLTAARGVLTFLVIVVPTTCMGATLPFLARLVTSDDTTGGRLPRLYALNTLGGAAGSLLSAYAVLPLLGVRGTMRAAALINIAIGVGAILLSRSMADVKPREASSAAGGASGASGEVDKELLLFAFASGFLVFATEVVGTHLLTLLIGNSAYAFGLMLAVFLVCLGFGATRASSLAARHGAKQGLGRGLALSALALALTIPLWDQLPRFFAAAGKLVESWAGRELCRALAAFGILALPTLFMGTTFPLLLARISTSSDVARNVGRLTVANTAGTIVGSIVTGYFVLPLLGSQRTLVGVALLFAVLAAFSARSPQRDDTKKARVTVLLAGAAILGALFMPRWDLARLTNGANVYFTHGPPPDDIIFVREDVHGGVTTVTKRRDLLTLYTNGKFQGDDGPEMSAQRRFAHFPALFLKQEERALVIGLGTGTTLGAVAAYPFSQIDVAEISPAIVEASATHFTGPSRGTLSDPRVAMHLNDGRNVLLVAKEPYDLITIELTSVWFAGASNLYSTEFYQLAKSRLKTGGVLQQWVQLHHIRPRELAAIVRTLLDSFAHVALFEGGAQGILVSSDEPLIASQARLRQLDRRPDIRETLEGDPLGMLIEELIASDEDLHRLVDDIERQTGERILSTDDNLFLEYATPKGNVLEYHSSLAASRELLERYRTADPRGRHVRP
ncbi:MAG: fused MFS/spermidine synthase [Polyangiaceae bacterium]|jgi:spermidine synthase|nr:fused MFS/spermidine synthase [Polyangiaceae bacterium]